MGAVYEVRIRQNNVINIIIGYTNSVILQSIDRSISISQYSINLYIIQ